MYECGHMTMKTKKLKKPRNFVAKDLFTAKYSMKVEKSSVIFYNRASEKQKLEKIYGTF
jgi:hypothetical protein